MSNPRHRFSFLIRSLQLALLAVLLHGQASAQTIEQLEKLARKSRNYSEQYKFGMHYFNGDVSGKDTGDAVTQFKKAARELHEAQLMLGLCYVMGEGIKKNEKEALKWFEKAAFQGNRSAMFRLAACYEKGIGTDKDPAGAYRW